jgi:3-oxoacyl-[acyl-carrier-protein] synthase-3
MSNIRATITGIEAFLPDYVLTNEELSRMVDTSDEWIMQRIGIKTRHILKDKNLGTSYMGAEAVKKLFAKTGTSPNEIDLVVVGTVTPDHAFPNTACIIADKVGIKNAWAFDISAACSGFLYSMQTVSQFIMGGRYKKALLITGDKMSSIVNYADRNTCCLFGDAAVAMLIEPTTEDIGLVDHIFQSDGSGRQYLYLAAGGSACPPSHETIDAGLHYVHQDGQPVFKAAVSKMGDVATAMMEKHNITPDDLAWLVPHQANLRIIEATGRRMGLDKEKVMVNIERYGNTTAATIPLCLWDWEKQLKKGDKLIFAAFGGGFTWGSIYYKWGYNS